ncbi:branched-chain amino acid ABC transporter permease [Bordetella hinzii]|uniref:Branched-chain amino acid ABC transporter permease n=3 Tax=Bordetella hinzii TaxID=103855 RepID=A0AAN1S1J0_9BORD|nr:leucine/isoleucine/valine transporter permease subunit [Bordetella hinzii]KCB22420.1 branched-chain amino acid ABC transporter, permease protein [Bordetella hinzii OH87 BAL007II]KCB29756.1 branched-chain amino acid ABC transporter, permease protein [Bordetella hinzii L60]KCB41639.1 branched-chain amino acid ABC transporter, permease protein [Bordetella hinzii 5132]KCB43535.1 branched-chain amino acid ABC transporter, permease protein [Bordetella hinzii 4161]
MTDKQIPAAGHPGLPKWPIAVALLAAALLALVPLAVRDAFTLQVLLLAIMFGALGACWNLVGGFLGRISFGHGVFIGVGGYTTLLLLQHLKLTPLLGIPLGGLISAALAWLVGGPTLRLSGHYFAMATIALLQIGLLLMVNWDWAGGAVGLEAPIADAPWMLLFRTKVPYYWIALALAFLTFLATYLLVHSRTGFYWRAINGDEAAARSLGVPADRYKMLAFVLSAGMTGVWGGFFAMYVGFIDPESMFSLTMSVQVVLVAILGGVGTLVGPWLGAAVLLPLSEGTRVAWGSSGLGLDLLIFGLAILLVTLFLPGGLVTLRRRRGTA